MAQSEKLNLWDRFFNRYRREIMEEGEEDWAKYLDNIEQFKTRRSYVKYKIIDRLTGSEKIEKVYLN